jgi:SAM-dependent methyltransferase
LSRKGQGTMSIDEARRHYVRYFTEKLRKYGATSKGVDYNSAGAQELRFEQLIKIVRPDRPFSLIDYGCGYGALYDFLSRKGLGFTYVGFDIIDDMVRAATETHANAPQARFTSDAHSLPVADYVVAGAIFNNKFEADTAEWTDMVLKTLRHMDRLSTKGFSFNMLTRYSDEHRMAARTDLYFGDPLFFFDYCTRHIARHVALLQDYGLHDFTILVRKES